MKTISAYITAPEHIEFIEEELPELGEHDLLIKTEAVGMCHTDLPVYLCQQAFGLSEHGYRKTVKIDSGSKLGHEPVGTVVQVGSKVTKFAVGDHVTGFYSHAFTTYRVLPEDTILVKIPDLQPGRDWRTCVVEPMGCVTNILHYMEQDPMEYVGVVGCGYMNLMVIAALRNKGLKEIVAIDIRDDKLEEAKKYGATHVYNSTKTDIVEEIYQLTGGKFLDTVVEMSGSIKGLQSACSVIKFARPGGLPTEGFTGRGRIIITSVYTAEETFPKELGYEMVLRCPILDAAHPMSGQDIMRNEQEAVALFADGTIPMDQMISHTYRFQELGKAFELLLHPTKDYVKGIVYFD